jgi:cyanophycinase
MLHWYRHGLLAALVFASGLGCSNRQAPTSWEEISEPAAESESALNARMRPVRVPQRLMIIGTIDGELVGKVSRDAIFTDRLIADVGGPEKLRLLVVPGASASPAWLADYLRQVLALRGIAKSHVELAHIASVDDETTPDADESTWNDGAYRRSELAKLERANVVFFAGGDQNRLVSLLRSADGRDSPFHAALKAKFAAHGVIIAGYSAGAAVFSDPMIGNGTSFGALSLPPSSDPGCNEDDKICITPGLGFLPSDLGVMVDQHFAQQGRFARLVRALALTGRPTGIGVEIDTALYIDMSTRQAEIVGDPSTANVTIIGRTSAEANHERPELPFVGDNYEVSVLRTGDVYALPDANHVHGVPTHLEPSEVYAPFSAYYGTPPILTDAFGNMVLPEKVTQWFADGAPQASGARVDTIAFVANEQGAANGFRLRFTATDESRVAWNEDIGYSMFGARLGISTISAQFTGLGP